MESSNNKTKTDENKDRIGPAPSQTTLKYIQSPESAEKSSQRPKNDEEPDPDAVINIPDANPDEDEESVPLSLGDIQREARQDVIVDIPPQNEQGNKVFQGIYEDQPPHQQIDAHQLHLYQQASHYRNRYEEEEPIGAYPIGKDVSSDIPPQYWQGEGVFRGIIEDQPPLQKNNSKQLQLSQRTPVKPQHFDPSADQPPQQNSPSPKLKKETDKKPEKDPNKFFFGILDYRDGCMVNFCKVTFAIILLPFILVYKFFELLSEYHRD